jgi:hypothetical protein
MTHGVHQRDGSLPVRSARHELDVTGAHHYAVSAKGALASARGATVGPSVLTVWQFSFQDPMTSDPKQLAIHDRYACVMTATARPAGPLALLRGATSCSFLRECPVNSKNQAKRSAP